MHTRTLLITLLFIAILPLTLAELTPEAQQEGYHETTHTNNIRIADTSNTRLQVHNRTRFSSRTDFYGLIDIYGGSAIRTVGGSIRILDGFDTAFRAGTDGVGIGTNNPQEQLHVEGNILATGSICDINGNCVTGGGSSLWSQDGNNVYRSSGYVGIGTDDPQNNLHLRLPTGSAGYGRGLIISEGTAPRLWLGLSNLGARLSMYQGTTETIRLSADPAENNFFNAGNIGIGTTDPQHALDVERSGETTIRARSTTTSPPSHAGFQASAGSVQGILRADGLASRLILATTSNSPISVRTNNVERLRVTASGDVGIGTQNPTTQLHATESALIEENLDVGGDLQVEGHAHVKQGISIDTGSHISGRSTDGGTPETLFGSCETYNLESQTTGSVSDAPLCSGHPTHTQENSTTQGTCEICNSFLCVDENSDDWDGSGIEHSSCPGDFRLQCVDKQFVPYVDTRTCEEPTESHRIVFDEQERDLVRVESDTGEGGRIEPEAQRLCILTGSIEELALPAPAGFQAQNCRDLLVNSAVPKYNAMGNYHLACIHSNGFVATTSRHQENPVPPTSDSWYNPVRDCGWKQT